MAQCHIALDHKLEAVSLLRGYLSVSAAASLKFKAEAEAALAKLGVPGAPAVALAVAGQVSASLKANVEVADKLYAAGDFAGALKIYADFVGISEAKAKRTRDEFFPKAAIDPDRVVGLDTIVKDAVELKFTAAPLTKEQIAELVQIPPR
jgi:hypothetical protein